MHLQHTAWINDMNSTSKKSAYQRTICTSSCAIWKTLWWRQKVEELQLIAELKKTPSLSLVQNLLDRRQSTANYWQTTNTRQMGRTLSDTAKLSINCVTRGPRWYCATANFWTLVTFTQPRPCHKSWISDVPWSGWHTCRAVQICWYEAHQNTHFSSEEALKGRNIASGITRH